MEIIDYVMNRLRIFAHLQMNKKHVRFSVNATRKHYNILYKIFTMTFGI